MRITSPLRSILGARWLTPKAKWTLLTEPFRKSQHNAEESVYTFLSKRIGEEAVVKIVDAVMTGIYAGDIHQLSADVVFKELKEGVVEHGSSSTHEKEKDEWTTYHYWFPWRIF